MNTTKRRKVLNTLAPEDPFNSSMLKDSYYVEKPSALREGSNPSPESKKKESSTQPRNLKRSVKVGDLVKVFPARAGLYIVTGRAYDKQFTLVPYWHLHPVYEEIPGNYGPMSEEYIEVISESR